MAYAENTTVPVGKTRGEIEALLEKAGATQFASGSCRESMMSVIQFRIENRMVKLTLPIPSKEKPCRAKVKDRSGRFKSGTALEKVLRQEERRLWRCLLIMVKAKLEWIDMGMSTFEREFLADIYLPSGETVHEMLAPKLEQAYMEGEMPPLLGMGGA